MLWQPIRPFEFTSPVVDIIKYPLLAIKPISTIIFAVPYLRSKLTFRQINERILEIPFVLSRILKNQNILDVGSNESFISLMAASQNNFVIALDLRSATINHHRITNVQADITRWSKPDYFDTIICLSTLEHIGLEVYGGKKNSNADQLAINNIYASLKSKGRLLLTVPASVLFQTTPTWRSYDFLSLQKLLKKFKKINYEFCVRDENQHWSLVDKIPKDHAFDLHMPSAVALIEAIK